MDDLTRQFLRQLWRGTRYACYASKDRRGIYTSFWTRSESPAEPPDYSAGDVYFQMHGLNEIPTTNAVGEPKAPAYLRGRVELVSAVNCVYADLDRKEHEPDAAFWNRVHNVRPRPSVVVATGSGAHVYVLLSEPLLLDDDAIRSAAIRLQRRWCESVHGEGKDLARAPRLPGTLNHKYEPARPVDFESCDLRRTYTLAQVRACLPPVLPQRIRPTFEVEPTNELARALFAKAVEKSSSSRNEAGLWLACQLRDNRFDEHTAASLLKQFANSVVQPQGKLPYREREALASLKQAYAKSPREPLHVRRES